MASPALVKKTPAAPQLGDKYNIKPAVLKRPRYKVLLSFSLSRPRALLWTLLEFTKQEIHLYVAP